MKHVHFRNIFLIGSVNEKAELNRVSDMNISYRPRVRLPLPCRTAKRAGNICVGCNCIARALYLSVN